MARDSSLKTIAPLAVLAFLTVWNVTPPHAMMNAQEIRESEHSVYYAGCDEVRDAGRAPLYAGDPGYREGMDGDGDGVACEPYRNQ